MNRSSPPKPWSVYILKCADDSLYTGISNDVQARLKAHENGKGAKYTKARRPLTLIYQEPAKNRSEASKREAEIKKMPRALKVALVTGLEE